MADSQFNFRALQDSLQQTNDRLARLERVTASGVMLVASLAVTSSAGGNPQFDGPSGGLTAQYYRHNEFVYVQFTGFLTSVNGSSGYWVINTPWPIYGPRRDANYGLIGSFESVIAGAIRQGSIYVAGPAANAATVPYTTNYGSGANTLSATTPGTWNPNDQIRGFLAGRIAPGY